MSELSKAVFLSYASQDAEAAKRICNTLRAAGMQVWFDVEGGLETGDEWDAKIRRQIKECVLFIPIISANTQARDEGYFRIEWELAAERAMGIAHGVAFILPIVVDATAESAALVPDRFRRVQWTRARDGELTPELKQRFLVLWSHRTGALKQTSTQHGGTAERPDGMGESGNKPPRTPNRHRSLWTAAAIVAVLVGGALAQRYWPSDAAPATATPAEPKTALVAKTSPPSSESARMIQEMWAIHDKVNDGTPEEWALAEEMGERLVKEDSLNAEAWAALSSVQMLFVIFGMDQTAERQSKAARAAERAIILAPTSVNARIAQATARRLGDGAARAEAVAIMRKLMAEQPNNRRVLRTASNVFKTAELYEESLRALDASTALPGGDPIARLSRADTLLRMGRYQEARAVASSALKFNPGIGARALHATYALLIDDNLAEAEAALKELPVSWLQSETGADLACVIALYQRDPDRCREILSRYPGSKLRTVPKGVVLGAAYRAAGRLGAARAEWQRVAREVDADLAVRPTDAVALSYRALVGALLGRTAEATADFEAWREMQRADASSWRSMAGRVLLELGRETEAIEQLGAGLEKAKGQLLLARAVELRRSPDFDRIRDRPEFQALLARVDAILPRPDAAALAAPLDEKSVAVLAFANLSSDKEQEYFSDGISEELLNVLAKVPGLKVSARTSAFHFKGKDTPIAEIARQLGVAYVVEGSVRKQGDKVRITAQLIKAADGFHVWSETFTRDLKDVFAVQDEIAGLVARSLSLKLGTSSSRKVAAVSPQAFEHYVQARQSWSLRTPEGFARAEQMLNRALELAPDFIRARAALIDVVQMRSLRERRVGNFGQRHSPEIDQRLAQVREVLALDPDLAEAYSTLGQTLDSKWLRDEAGQAYRRATELNPNYATGRQWYGMHLAELGYMDEALTELKAACDLDPFSFIILDNYGWLLHLAGRTSEALQMLDRAAALNPGFDQTSRVRAVALKALGRTAEAETIARRLRNNQRELDVWTLGTVGLPAEAKALLTQMDPRDVTNRFQALLSAGEREAALEALADPSGASKGDSIDILYQPIFDPIRTDPRFIGYLSVLKLTEAHHRAQTWRRLQSPGQPEAKP